MINKNLESALDIDVVDQILKTSKIYYHCCRDGIIYSDEDKTIPLINLIDLTGSPQIPRELNKYIITSGYCLKCELETFI